MFPGFGVECERLTSRAVQQQAERSTSFLRMIDETIDNIQSNIQFFQTMTVEFRQFGEYLANCPPTEDGQELDASGGARAAFLATSEKARALYERAIAKREAARKDVRLTGDDGVEDAYTQYIEAIADFHNTIEDTRDVLDTICALQSSSTGKKYASAADMFADLIGDASAH